MPELPSSAALFASCPPNLIPQLKGNPMPLGPGEVQTSLQKALAAVTLDELFGGQTIRDPAAANCCLAGLWLRHNFLDESHTLSQEIQSLEGSYWHGIMHRREPDYGNAKYWFRRVPQHAIFQPLALIAQKLALAETAEPVPHFLLTQTTWNPAAFVDLCEQIARENATCETLAQAVAQAECELLMEHCYQLAVGK